MDYTFLADLHKELAPPGDGILSRILHKDEKVGVPGDLCASEGARLEQGECMARGKKYQREQVVNLLRQI